MAVRTVSRMLDLDFKRIQFTRDMQPADITGQEEKNREGEWETRMGPIHNNMVLADEINRAKEQTQGGMLEAMAEKQVTVDNQTYKLDDLFFVIATQNPLDVAGTYPLPTPQLDRFLFKISMKPIERDAELRVLEHYPRPSLVMSEGLPRVSRDELIAARGVLRAGVFIAPAIREALVDLARGLREDQRVLQGASTRSLVLMLPALQARALIRGRDHVAPQDVEALAPHVFNHRIETVPGVTDRLEVIRDCSAPIVDRLAKLSLKR